MSCGRPVGLPNETAAVIDRWAPRSPLDCLTRGAPYKGAVAQACSRIPNPSAVLKLGKFRKTTKRSGFLQKTLCVIFWLPLNGVGFCTKTPCVIFWPPLNGLGFWPKIIAAIFWLPLNGLGFWPFLPLGGAKSAEFEHSWCWSYSDVFAERAQKKPFFTVSWCCSFSDVPAEER